MTDYGDVRRNETCPCGSGKKFKYCHGGAEYHNMITRGAAHAQIARQLAMATDVERQKTQGLGKPIQSVHAQGTRLVFVGRRKFTGSWKTFSDFLMFYIGDLFKGSWGNSELAKAPEDRHPLLNLYQKVCLIQKQYCIKEGEPYEMPYMAAVSAYMGLAYDLYCIEHNARTQPVWERWMHKLRTPEHFYATTYEVMAGGAFARAGFTLDFEDDTDLDKSHVEFIATHPVSGKIFAVECKCRQANEETSPSRVGRQLARALQKTTDLERIVFIELSLPVKFETPGITSWLRDAISQIGGLEFKNGRNLPPAYVFLTNRPQFHLQDERESGAMGYLHGFKIPELRYRGTGPIEDLVDARDKHPEVHDLLRSLNLHSSIPDTFDGTEGDVAFAGRPSSESPPLRTPLDYYDFMVSVCREWPRANLLQQMSEWPNAAELEFLDNKELVRKYSMRWAMNLMHHAESNVPNTVKE